jgi:hypothetical protein
MRLRTGGLFVEVVFQQGSIIQYYYFHKINTVCEGSPSTEVPLVLVTTLAAIRKWSLIRGGRVVLVVQVKYSLIYHVCYCHVYVRAVPVEGWSFKGGPSIQLLLYLFHTLQ